MGVLQMSLLAVVAMRVKQELIRETIYSSLGEVIHL